MASLPTLDKNANSYINFIWVFLGVAETIVGSLLCSLHSKRFQSSYCTKVRTRAKKGGRGRGMGEEETSFPSFPSPSPVIPFFYSRPNFLDKLARKRLLRRLAFVLWCEYCSVSFHSFVWRHLVIGTHPQHQKPTSFARTGSLLYILKGLMSHWQ